MRDRISNVLKRKIPNLYYQARHLRDKIDIIRQKIIPFYYNEKRYSNTFLIHSVQHGQIKLPLERVIYCFWTGDNPLTENRQRGLASLQQNTGVKLILVTPNNLKDFILPDFPLHPAYEYLSLIHRADYLRCYFMHHYGGGYADIKPFNYSWIPAFEQIEKNAAYYIVGYTEIRKNAVANVGGVLVDDMRKYYTKILGNGAYICRAMSPFTSEWFAEVNKRLDHHLPALKRYGYFPEDYKGQRSGYPIPFLSILGEIFHPLCLKYHKKLLHNQKLIPDLHNYQ